VEILCDGQLQTDSLFEEKSLVGLKAYFHVAAQPDGQAILEAGPIPYGTCCPR
jgi:hypothetical protein